VSHSFNVSIVKSGSLMIEFNEGILFIDVLQSQEQNF
jgi:hypothetical protein